MFTNKISSFFPPNSVIFGGCTICDFFGENIYTKYGENRSDSLLLTKSSCKICEFVGENSFTKYCENERDSLKLFTKISLNLVIFWGNHQITTNKNPNANKLINYLWWGGVRPCATDLLSNASSISCLSRVQFCLVFLFVNFSFFNSGFRLLGFFPHLCTREKADDKRGLHLSSWSWLTLCWLLTPAMASSERRGQIILRRVFSSKMFNFYRTQVYLGSDLWVRVSLTHSLTH